MNPRNLFSIIRGLACLLACALHLTAGAQRLVNEGGNSVLLNGSGAVLGGFRYGGQLQFPGASGTTFVGTAQNPVGTYEDSPTNTHYGFAASPSASFLAGGTTYNFF